MKPGKARAYGFFGGSFDPVQRGHVALALAALRERGLKKVYLVPAARSPHKGATPLASDADRLAMLRRAIRGKPGLAIGRWELDRPAPSYTYQTLRLLRRRYPKRRWEVILGEDAWADFGRWRRWKEITRHHPVVVGRRAGAGGGVANRSVFRNNPGPLSPPRGRDRVGGKVSNADACHPPSRPSGTPLSRHPSGGGLLGLPPISRGEGEKPSSSSEISQDSWVVAVFLRSRAPGVSSTEVRGRLARGEGPGRLVPPGVGDYIRQKGLYGGARI